MHSRSHSVLILILVVGLAGCSGMSPFGSDVTYPSGYNESGITDSKKALEQHTSTLAEYDNFSVKLNVSSSTSDVNLNSTSRIDSANKRAHTVFDITRSGQQLTLATYQANNTSYRKVDLSILGTRYNATNQSFSSFKENLSGRSLIQTGFGNMSFEGADQVTRDGETLLRYNSTNVTNAEPFTRSVMSGNNTSVDNFNATVLVGQEGLVRSITYSIAYPTSGKTERLTATYRVTKLNATTVEKPDWVEKAKSQSQS